MLMFSKMSRYININQCWYGILLIPWKLTICTFPTAITSNLQQFIMLLITFTSLILCITIINDVIQSENIRWTNSFPMNSNLLADTIWGTNAMKMDDLCHWGLNCVLGILEVILANCSDATILVAYLLEICIFILPLIFSSNLNKARWSPFPNLLKKPNMSFKLLAWLLILKLHSEISRPLHKFPVTI